MPWQGGNLTDNPEWSSLNARVKALENRMGVAQSAATALKTTPKRFRVAVKSLAALVADRAVSFPVAWSSPLPSATYNIDVSCSAFLDPPTVSISNQTPEGCTITFTPGVAAPSAVVTVLAIAPATPT